MVESYVSTSTYLSRSNLQGTFHEAILGGLKNFKNQVKELRKLEGDMKKFTPKEINRIGDISGVNSDKIVAKYKDLLDRFIAWFTVYEKKSQEVEKYFVNEEYSITEYRRRLVSNVVDYIGALGAINKETQDSYKTQLVFTPSLVSKFKQALYKLVGIEYTKEQEDEVEDSYDYFLALRDKTFFGGNKAIDVLSDFMGAVNVINKSERYLKKLDGINELIRAQIQSRKPGPQYLAQVFEYTTAVMDADQYIDKAYKKMKKAIAERPQRMKSIVGLFKLYYSLLSKYPDFDSAVLKRLDAVIRANDAMDPDLASFIQNDLKVQHIMKQILAYIKAMTDAVEKDLNANWNKQEEQVYRPAA